MNPPPIPPRDTSSQASTPPPIPPTHRHQRTEDHAGMRMLVPVGRSGWAVAAGYMGLFSVALIGAPLAVVFGILGVREIRQSRDTDHPKYGMGRAVFGIVFGALGMIAIIYLTAMTMFSS